MLNSDFQVYLVIWNFHGDDETLTNFLLTFDHWLQVGDSNQSGNDHQSSSFAHVSKHMFSAKKPSIARGQQNRLYSLDHG